MHYTDLELYRWKWHNEVYLKFKRVQAVKYQLPLSSYWKEFGAFVSVLPRQIGKSTMIATMTRIFEGKEEPFIVMVPNMRMALHFCTNQNVSYKNVGADAEWVVSYAKSKLPHITNLLIDEFDFISEDDMNKMLSYDWSSVSMASSLK